MKIKEADLYPGKGWILIKEIEWNKETSAGVALPDTVEEAPMLGEVLKIGGEVVKEGGVIETPPSFDILDKSGKPKSRQPLKIGDTIIYKQHTNHEIVGDDGVDKIAFVNFDSILGVIFK